jgi:membrane protein implicated in regulation of membrane protease activity
LLGLADPMSAVFLLCFFVGVLYVLATAVMGLGHDFIHLPSFGVGGHGHDVAGAGHSAGDAAGATHHLAGLDHAGAHDHAAGFGHSGGATSDAAYTPSPVSLFNLMAFLTCFGAVGYILRTSIDLWWPLSLLLALVAGTAAAWGTWLFLARVLIPGAKAVSADEIIGKVGTITVELPAGGIGEIVYTLGGARHSDGARSLDGAAIPHGTEVVITRFEKGIAYVDTWEHFTEEGKQ